MTTPLILLLLLLCLSSLLALHRDSRQPDGMPSRRQVREWKRWRHDIRPAIRR